MAIISDLKKALGEGLRTSKYEVSVPSISGAGVPPETFLCKAASFPAKTVGQTEIWKLGRKAMIPGEVEYENTWELTFFDKHDSSVREYFIKWMSSVNDYNSNMSGGAEFVTSTLKVKNMVPANDSDMEAGAEYRFFNAYPQAIGAIDFASDSINAIGEFSVTFSFDYWSAEE